MKNKRMKEILKRVAVQNGVSYEAVCRDIGEAVSAGAKTGHPLLVETEGKGAEEVLLALVGHVLRQSPEAVKNL